MQNIDEISYTHAQTYNYALINELGICYATQSTSLKPDEDAEESMIIVDTISDDLLGRKYDSDSESWSEEKYFSNGELYPEYNIYNIVCICGHEYTSNFNFCPKCGKRKPVLQGRFMCELCGYLSDEEFKFCPQCGEENKTSQLNLIELKINELNTMREKIITNGVQVETSIGTKNFSLEQSAQTELMAQKSELEKALMGFPSSINLDKGVPYDADNELCRFWSVEDFSLIVKTVMEFIFYHRAYCNHLLEWVRRSNIEELDNIYYGAILPDDLQENLNDHLGINQVLENDVDD